MDRVVSGRNIHLYTNTGFVVYVVVIAAAAATAAAAAAMVVVHFSFKFTKFIEAWLVSSFW